MENSKQPAHPISEQDYRRYSDSLPDWTGLTKRELIAAMAMQGILATISGLTQITQKAADTISKEALMCTDVLLSELDKPTNK